MKHAITLFLFVKVVFFFIPCCGQALPKPSPVQYRWHEQERIMFLCLDPCTWQGREYDNHSISLDRIKLEKIDTDQWCEAARLWGAKEILFVAKHTGGFCWWQTETSDYGIRNTPYKDGKGDVLKELSGSCKKYGLNLGIYIYPGDETWGAGIGSGGRTIDPSKQEQYNEVFRQQLRETLNNYGEVIEIWFDGSCAIDITDIIEEHANTSVVFQGPHATIRWAGTESGKLFYPVWNTVDSEDLSTGVSTQIHDNPEGDVWAPVEANTTLYDHYWFWSPVKAEKRKTLDQLMNCYYRSVGYGSVFLLNSTPDTAGLIPTKDMDLYKAFGEEIDRRFKTPIQEVRNKEGELLTVTLPEVRQVNHVVIMEDYREGQRIREYSIEGFNNGKWTELTRGQSIGRKKIDFFSVVKVSALRLKILNVVGIPKIRRLSIYFVKDFKMPEKEAVAAWSAWEKIKFREKEELEDGSVKIAIDLSGHINLPGQYILKVTPHPQTKINLLNPHCRVAPCKMLKNSGNWHFFNI